MPRRDWSVNCDATSVTTLSSINGSPSVRVKCQCHCIIALKAGLSSNDSDVKRKKGRTYGHPEESAAPVAADSPISART